jgi:tetratricopeptide (TPR) repeat protein
LWRFDIVFEIMYCRPVPNMKSLTAAGLFFLTALAQADACNEALARFDYPAAQAAANAALQASPKDAAAWLCLGRARYERGDFPVALAALNEAARQPVGGSLAVQLGNWFGVTLRRLGRQEEAWARQQSALKLAQAIGDQAGLATALHNTAGMRYDRGDVVGALRDYRSSVKINPDDAERSASFNNMGLILQAGGDQNGARHALEAAITLNRAGGHFHHLGKHLMNLGNLERQLGRYDEAGRLLDEGRALVEKAGDVFWLGVAAHYRAWLANDLHQPPVARAAYEEAKRYYQQAGTAGDLARLESELAKHRFP